MARAKTVKTTANTRNAARTDSTFASAYTMSVVFNAANNLFLKLNTAEHSVDLVLTDTVTGTTYRATAELQEDA
jgi:hypothetical protein